MPLDRRTIDDIVAIHQLEGHKAREVFVEGASDKYFFEYFLSGQGLGSVGVYEVDSVEVPTQEVIDRGLKDGKKGRVVTLASLLEGRVEVSEVVCIADADFDHFKGVTYPFLLLLITDYFAIELYAFNTQTINKLLLCIGGTFPKDARAFLAQVRPALETAFLIRMANEDLDLGCEVPDVHRFCTYNTRSDTITLAEHNLITELVRRYVGGDVRRRVETHVQHHRSLLGQDPRFQIHGHDFYEMTTWFIRQHPGFGSVHPTTIPSCLTACFVETEWLLKEHMFAEIVKRLRSDA